MKFQTKINAIVGLSLLAAPMFSQDSSSSQSQRALVSGIPSIPPPATPGRNPRPFKSVEGDLSEARIDLASGSIVLKYGSAEWMKLGSRVSEMGGRDGDLLRPEVDDGGRQSERGQSGRDNDPSTLGSRGDYQVGAMHGDFMKHSGRFSQNGGVSQIGARPAQQAARSSGSDSEAFSSGSEAMSQLGDRVSENGAVDGGSGRSMASPDGRQSASSESGRDNDPSQLASRGDYQVGAQHGDFVKHSGDFSQSGGVLQTSVRPAQQTARSSGSGSDALGSGSEAKDQLGDRVSENGAVDGGSGRSQADPGGRQSERGQSGRDNDPSQLGSRGDYQVGAMHGDYLKHSGRLSQSGGVSQLGARPAPQTSRQSPARFTDPSEQFSGSSSSLDKLGEGSFDQPDRLALLGAAEHADGRTGHIVIDVGPSMTGAEKYGQGFAGLIGTPQLSYLGEISPGSTIQLFAENSSGAATSGYLLAGYSAVQEKLRTGATVLASTDILIRRVNLSAGTASLSFTIPSDALLNGNAIYTQVIMKDPAAFGGWAMTNGLKLIL